MSDRPIFDDRAKGTIAGLARTAFFLRRESFENVLEAITGIVLETWEEEQEYRKDREAADEA